MSLNSLLISGSQVRALLGSPSLVREYLRLSSRAYPQEVSIPSTFPSNVPEGNPKMATQRKSKTPSKKTATSDFGEKRTYFKQSDFPQMSLQQAQRIASAIVDNFASEGGSPPDIALALEISPTSSVWQTLTGYSIAYGLTVGGINANVITLTPLGKKLVAPEEEGEDLIARREAVLKPRIQKEFFERYRRAKFPNDNCGKCAQIDELTSRSSDDGARNNKSQRSVC